LHLALVFLIVLTLPALTSSARNGQTLAVSSFNAGTKTRDFSRRRRRVRRETGGGTLEPLQEEEDLDATPVVPFLKSHPHRVRAPQ
jgi:hypothetical protein